MDSGKKARQPGPALYVHIPFCLQKCGYCSFFSLTGKERQYAAYVRAVIGQVRGLGRDSPLPAMEARTIFFGGGTPTVFAQDQLAGLLAEILRTHAGPTQPEELEISIEANPASVDLAGLRALRRAGFNRLSLGVQSLDDGELQKIGRIHTAADAAKTMQLARRAGFANINLDLMYGLPGQSVRSWRETLVRALELGPEHLALYELTIEENTPLARRLADGALSLPPEEHVLEMLAINQELTALAGLQRYEISNYARPGFQCRHNLTYWHNRDYLGLGAGAVSCLDGVRTQTVKNIDHYIRAIEGGKNIFTGREELEEETRFRETMIMGLRLTEGIDIGAIGQRFGINPIAYYGQTLARLKQDKLVEITETHIRLSAKGLLFANQVMRELV